LTSDTERKKLEEMLTDLDPPYESADELRIGRLLDQYGIPFFYKQPMLIYDQGKNALWKPAFTLPSYGCLVIDYVPSSEQSRKDQVQQKEHAYKYNQVPAVLVRAEDLELPNWDHLLCGKIEQAYRASTDQYPVAKNSRTP